MENTPFDKLIEIYRAEPELSPLPSGTPLPREFAVSVRVLGFMVNGNPADAIYIAEGSTVTILGKPRQRFSIKYSSFASHDKAQQIIVDYFDQLDGCRPDYRFTFQALQRFDLATVILRSRTGTSD